MPITRTPIIDDDGSGQTGTGIDNSWKQQFYDQIDALVTPLAAAVGAVINTPFNAADYTGSGGMPWTVTAGNVTANTYQRVGNLLTWMVYLNGTATTGTPSTTLNIRLPAGLIATRNVASQGMAFNGGVWIHVALVANGNQVQITKIDNLNFTIDAAVWLRFQFHIPVS